MAVFWQVLFLSIFSQFLGICYSNNNSSSSSMIDYYSSYIDVDPSFSESLLLPTISSFMIVSSVVSSSPIISSSAIISSSSISITEPVFSSPPTVIISPALTSTLIPLQSTPVTLTSANITQQFSASTSCLCDLTVQLCDTDCCCDNDCTTIDRDAFSQCLNQQEQTYIQTCLPTTTLFRTSLLATRGSDLFCVYTDNYPGRLTFPETSLANTLDKINRQLTLYSKTGDQATPISSLTQSTSSTRYQSGDLLSIVYNTSNHGYLTLPTSLNGDVCHDGNPITYLNDVTSTCTRYLSNECIYRSPFNPLLYYQNITISSLPGDLNDTVSFQVKNITCLNLIGQSISCDQVPSPQYNSSSNTCTNVLIRLNYYIFHNGSNGIVQAMYDATIRESSVGPISQQFGVSFISISGDTSDSINYTALIESHINSIKRSGNPGYIDGQPVLAGNLSNDVVSVHVDRSNWLTLLKPGPTGSECNGDSTRQSVTFRDNMKTSCILRVSSSVIQSGCTDIGSQTRTLLLGTTGLGDRIGIYGNSDPRNLSEWIPIFGLSEVPTTFRCTSIITGIHITILYSYSGQVSSPVAFITGAKLDYITQDITTQCPSLSCSSSLVLSLHSSVTFIPSYSILAQVLQTTRLSARTVPQDFLYPLLFPSSGGIINCCNSLLTFSLSTMIMLVLL